MTEDIRIHPVAWDLDAVSILETADRVVGSESLNVRYGNSLSDPVVLRFKSPEHAVAFRISCSNGWMMDN